LVPLTADSAESATAWFAGDADGSAEFGGFYGRHPKWWTLVEREEHRHGWIATDDTSEIGFADLDIAGSTATFAFYIRREWRGQGSGPVLLGLLASAARASGVLRLVGEATSTNKASLAAMRSAHFVEIGMTDDGYVRMELMLE
jgi:RimJ/RimL family protein N-acetyltransferase